MKYFILLGSSLLSVSALADISPSKDAVDLGISIGALNSKIFTLKKGSLTYHVIGADFDEPACNPVQVVLNIQDPALEDAGTVKYNLGIQISRIQSAKVMNREIVLRVQQNDPDNCSKHITKTVRITYKGNASDLLMRSEKSKQ